jgi:hypothetical protein
MRNPWAPVQVVKVLKGRRGQSSPEMAWEPKAAFTALAERYRR